MKTKSKNPFYAYHRHSRDKKNTKQKLLIIAAVILFIWLVSQAVDRYSEQKQAGNGSTSNFAVVKGEQQGKGLEQSGIDLLGGPFAGFEQILFNSAQAIDFSADDGFEDEDLVILQENSLLAVNCPSPEVIFSKFRKEIITYVVRSGDNPEKIAASFGINTDTLLWENNLSERDLIRPGDKLTILPINGIRIKVGAKDTIAFLAKKYQGKTEEIIAFNNLPADGSLKAGEYIIIPGGEKPAASVKTTPKAKTPQYAGTTQKADNWLIIPAIGRSWRRIHAYNGVDISNPCGTPIYAAAAGKVILSDASGWNGGYGKYIKIQHPNGVITLYAHASQLLVSGGEQVSQGQMIAYMGTTGRSTGCHLHFEVRGAKNPLTGK